MPDSQKIQFQVGGVPFSVLSVFLPLVVAGIFGYGAAKQVTGAQDAELQELRRLAASNKAEIDYLRSTSATKEQTQLLIKMVDDTHRDVSDIRSEISKRR